MYAVKALNKAKYRTSLPYRHRGGDMSFSPSLLSGLALRKVLLTLIFAVSALALPSQSQAAMTGCRGDPFIQLSNGMKIQLTVALDVDVGAVTNITYTVHAPAGTVATSIAMAQSSTTMTLASKEHIIMVYDLPPKQYKTTTVVTTLVPAAATVNATFSPGIMLSASGTNGSKGIAINYTAP
jgi:hypothetical protein